MATGVAGLTESVKDDFQSDSFDYRAPEYSANYSNAFMQKIFPIVPANVEQPNCIHSFEIGSIKDTHFIDFQNIYADVHFKVIQQGGTVLTAADQVSIVNNISHSMFYSIDCSINNTLVSDHGKNMGLRGYITNALSLPQDIKENNLLADFWIDDESDAVSLIDAASFTGDTSVKARKTLIALSEPVRAYFKPHIDIATCPRFLPPGNTLKLDFTLADSDYLLLAPTPTSPANRKYKFQIISMTLEVQRILPSSDMVRSVVESQKTPLYFPITRTIVRKFQIHPGQHDILINRVVDPLQLPFQLIIIPVENLQLNSISQVC